jgi:integrase
MNISITSQNISLQNNNSAVATNGIDDYIKAATSNNTRKAYRSDVRHFITCGGLLPATPEQIINYLHKNAAFLNPRTLSRRLTALKNWHVYQGFPDPTSNPMVRKTLTGIMNVHGKPKHKALALSTEQLEQIVTILKSSNTLIATRDNALLQIGFFGAFRRSELINIKVEHIKKVKEGVEILIPRSKTDQIGEGKICAIPYGKKKICPVTALTCWLKKAKIKDGPVFRKITKDGTLGKDALVTESITFILRRAIAFLENVDVKVFSAHSLRRGFATSASRNGASLPAIMRQGRWQHEGTVIEYIEESQRFEDNAANLVLSVINKS